MVKIYPGELTAIDLAEVGKTPGVRTATTPFGTYPKMYVGSSVRWKGRKVKGASKMTEEEIARVLGITKEYGILKDHGVATGLKKIVSKAAGVKDIHKVAIGTIIGTKMRRIPILV